jgi:hypothetical protein
MIGHVTLTAVDPDRAASHSRLVVDGIVRKKWNYQGVVTTDDLVMGAIYQHNVCTAVVEAINAGVDLLLVAFDGAQFYRIFACANDAFSLRGLDLATLHDSEARLRLCIPWTERRWACIPSPEILVMTYAIGTHSTAAGGLDRQPPAMFVDASKFRRQRADDNKTWTAGWQVQGKRSAAEATKYFGLKT